MTRFLNYNKNVITVFSSKLGTLFIVTLNNWSLLDTYNWPIDLRYTSSIDIYSTELFNVFSLWYISIALNVILMQRRIQWGGPTKIGKNMIFWSKIYVYQL